MCGISDSALQKKLLQEASLTLEKCLNICRAAEAANSQLKQISHQSPEAVHQLKHRGKPQSKGQQRQQQDCKYCGRKHERNEQKCPAYGKTCDNCSMKNHFSSVCQQKKKPTTAPQRTQHSSPEVHEVHEDSELSSDEEIWTMSLSEEVNSVSEKNRIYAGVDLGGKVIRMQIDTGAFCNVIPYNSLPANTEIKATNRSLIIYSKSKLNVLGTAMLNIRNPKNNAQYIEEFVVVENGFIPLLGVKTAQKMQFLVIPHQNILQLADENAETLINKTLRD